MSSVSDDPVSLHGCRSGAALGVVGAIVSTVKVVESGPETLLAASVNVTSRVFSPSESGVVGVRDQSPARSITHVPTSVPFPSVIVNTVPGSHVPVISGVLSLLIEPSIGVSKTRGVGANVSTVKVVVAKGETFPELSVAVAFTT